MSDTISGIASYGAKLERLGAALQDPDSKISDLKSLADGCDLILHFGISSEEVSILSTEEVIK